MNETIESLKFPDVKCPVTREVRLKNVARDVYLCVKTDAEGRHSLGTKTRSLDINSDPDLKFQLFYYVSAERKKPKVVLPVHKDTKVCLSMTPDKKLQISSLESADTDFNKIDPIENPKFLKKADGRFFYIWTFNSYFALEAINGTDENYFLCVTENNEPSIKLKTSKGNNYLDEMLFSLDSSEDEESNETQQA